MAPERSQPAALKLFHAGGRDAEIEEVFAASSRPAVARSG
jgi:hypothetical protein